MSIPHTGIPTGLAFQPGAATVRDDVQGRIVGEAHGIQVKPRNSACRNTASVMSTSSHLAGSAPVLMGPPLKCTYCRRPLKRHRTNPHPRNLLSRTLAPESRSP